MLWQASLRPLSVSFLFRTSGQAGAICGASHSKIDPEIFSHSACDKFFVTLATKVSHLCNILRHNETIFDIKGGFFTGPPLKVLSVRFDSSSRQKSSET